MLSVRLRDISGKVIQNIVPVKVTLCKEEGVPADSLEAVLKETELEELVTIELFSDGVLIFSGEVDEQIREISPSPHTEIVARSSAARLIDNEAYPMTLINPSAMDIFNRFAKPVGFTSMVGRNAAYQGNFTVSKGTSCFAVIKRFAAAVYGKLPRAEGDVLYIEGKEQEDVFEPDVGSILSLRQATLRYGRVSEVRLKLKEGEGYDSLLRDDDAVSKKINKVRYLNVTSASSSVPADADTILSNSRKAAGYTTLNCTGFYADALGKKVGGTFDTENLYVSAVKCTLNNSTEKTVLSLKRKEK